MSKNLLSMKPAVPFIISALTPVPLYAAALIAAGVITLEAAVELYLERSNLRHNNGLVYLLDLTGGSIEISSELWTRSAALARTYKV